MSGRKRTHVEEARGLVVRASALLLTEIEEREPDGVEVFALREQVAALSRELVAIRRVVSAGRRVVEVYAGRVEGLTQEEVAALARAIAETDAR